MPRDGRSGLYATEVAKAIGAPIFHINADKPEEVDKIMNIAY
jgi:2-oxoglutarate dehydrogenase complex dehydrogenase (E1) component-like enzyme